jgi:CheY-like chemotaxis protein
MNVAHEIKVLTNGQQAMDYLSRSASGESKDLFPDLIFLDIKMPVMDGFSFLEAYEASGAKPPDPVVILMLTSSASFYDLERLKNFPRVKKHFSKALTERDVKEILKEYFSTQL